MSFTKIAGFDTEHVRRAVFSDGGLCRGFCLFLFSLKEKKSPRSAIVKLSHFPSLGLFDVLPSAWGWPLLTELCLVQYG
jgi:hypothetical protein